MEVWGEGFNAGKFFGGGVISRGPTSNTTWTKPASNSKGHGVLGAFAGGGAGAFATNATCPADLEGPGETLTMNVGVGLVKFSLQLGFSGSTWIGSLTVGPGAGISVSDYPTYTSSGGN